MALIKIDAQRKIANAQRKTDTQRPIDTATMSLANRYLCYSRTNRGFVTRVLGKVVPVLPFVS